MYCKSISAAFTATLLASANAHFFINAPAPVPGSAIKDPLDASGSNFPCHGADLTQGTVTPMAAGSDQKLGFELGGGANTAVHGGGSCQISLTYETDATKQKDPANWKVIQSFVGGCPTDAKGNLNTAVMCDGSNGPECVNNLSFKVPAEVQNGNAILAWTWFNNVGNREMYMNCAKVSLTGGSGSMSSLPSMFVANLASVNQCATTENFNTDFPNPGKYVTTESPLNFPTKVASGSGCGTGSGSGGQSSGGGSEGSTGAASSAGTGTGSTPATSAANNGQYTAPAGTDAATQPSGGVFAPGASSAPVAASPTATSIIATTFVTSAATAPVATGTTGSTSSTGSVSTGATTYACTSGQVSCTASGFYCIDASTFGMCAWGCATPMQMAAGTSCTAGAVKAIVPSRQRRSSRHAHQARHVSPLL